MAVSCRGGKMILMELVSLNPPAFYPDLKPVFSNPDRYMIDL
jgi:hypothetical protein